MTTLITNKLVIGHSLEALQYAKTAGAMLLVNGQLKPHELDRPEDLRRWNLISFQLGLRGLSPVPSDIMSITVEEKKVSVVTEYYNKIEMFYNQLYLFDLEFVGGLSVEEEITEYLVYDWFDIKRGAKQENCKITGSGEFISELVFYPSRRRDGNTGVIKDCYTKSFIDAKLINKFENSETAALLAATALIKEHGLKGPPRKIDEKIHYLNVMLQHNRRDLYKNKKKYVFAEEPPEHIFYCNVHV